MEQLLSTTMNSSSPSIQPLPPGFRFHPSDQELIIHYLKSRVASSPLPASVIAEVDLYQFDPWELPKKAFFGEDEWYFFTPRDRKYPNGARPNRTAASGYWKATGIDKPIFTSCSTKSIGVKKALVFYSGRPPRGAKTEWIMHEYRLLDAATAWKQKGSMRLDDWVLCRVRKKSSIIRNRWADRSPPIHPAEGGYYHKAKGLWSMDKEPNAELFKKYINSCPLLPYLFNSPEFPLVGEDPSTGSGKAVQASTATAISRSPAGREEIEFSRSSFDNLFELFNGRGDEPRGLSGTGAGSRVSSHQGKADIFRSPENCNCTRNDDGHMNLRANDTGGNFTDGEGSHLLQSLRADQWNPVFQI